MPAPTGEFYELSEPEADKLNANGGREPLTFDDYVPHRARGQEGATFRLYWDQKRVLKNPPGHRTAEELEAHRQGQYAVYDARALWDWVKTHEKDPTNSFQISHEDWMQLYAEYGNFGPIPGFVSKLPSLEWPDFGPKTVWVYEESGVSKYNNKRWTGGRWAAMVDGTIRFKTFENFTKRSQEPTFLPTDGLYLFGPAGEQNVGMIRNAGFTNWLKGPKGHEQIYKTILPSGDTQFFATDEEPRASRHRAPPEHWSQHVRGRLIRQTDGTGLKTWHFKGPRRFERVDYQDTEVLEVDGLLERAHYTGKRGRERVYKVERFSQTQNDRLYDTHYLRGSSGNEKAYKRVGGDDGERHRKNWVAYYETGEEHPQALRRVEHVSHWREDGGLPSFNHWNAPGPHEGHVLTRTSIDYFEGPRGAETYVRSESTITGPDGYAEPMETELPEDDPDRREFAQRKYNRMRRKFSAWSPVAYLDPEP